MSVKTKWREWLAGAESEELPLEAGYRLLLPERVEVSFI